MTQLGVPYVWGAESPADGFDCSGLVQWSYAQIGVQLPRTTGEQVLLGVAVVDVERSCDPATCSSPTATEAERSSPTATSPSTPAVACRSPPRGPATSSKLQPVPFDRVRAARRLLVL